MRFARWTFGIAAAYGVLMLTPMYFQEQQLGRDYPPPLTHPEFYYGFVGVALAWQLAFVAIARDPMRLRPIMPFAVLEKLSFGIAAPVLYAQQRAPGLILAAGIMDLVFAVAFTVAWWKCGHMANEP